MTVRSSTTQAIGSFVDLNNSVDRQAMFEPKPLGKSKGNSNRIHV